MILVWILLVVGFVLLIKGADYFVEGSSAVAKILRIPSVVIGLTIVAMGTSAPELAVSVTAALTGNNEIAVGNVIGSNIFNLMVVTGTCGVILPMAVDKGILNGDFIFSILISGVLLAMFAFDMKIGHLDGVILLVLFAYFIIKLVRKALKEIGGDIIYTLPRDSAVQKAENQGKTVVEALPESHMAECYRNLAKQILEVTTEDEE